MRIKAGYFLFFVFVSLFPPYPFKTVFAQSESSPQTITFPNSAQVKNDVDYREYDLLPGNSTSGNEVIIAPGKPLGAAYGARGDSERGNALRNNTVIVRGGSVTLAYGAQGHGLVQGNRVVIESGRATFVYGGNGKSCLGNEVIMSGGTTQQIQGAVSFGLYNTEAETKGAVRDGDGWADAGVSKNNKVIFSGGEAEYILGAESGVVTGGTGRGHPLGSIENSVLISGGRVTRGVSAAEIGEHNTLTITGGEVRGCIATPISAGGRGKGNIITLRGTPKVTGYISAAEELQLDGYTGSLGSVRDIALVHVDERSHVSNERSDFFDNYDLKLVQVDRLVNDGVIELGGIYAPPGPAGASGGKSAKAEKEPGKAIFEGIAYSGGGTFELVQEDSKVGNIVFLGGSIDAPLRLTIKNAESINPFSDLLVVDGNNLKLNAGLTPGTAVQLVAPQAGGLFLSLRYEEQDTRQRWYLNCSGEK